MRNQGIRIPCPSREAELAFWQKVRVGSPDECWPWDGYARGGYGQTVRNFEGKRHMLRAHRYAYAIAHGGTPAGLDVMHTCDNPICCNPKHLQLGTHDDNMHDKKIKGRGRTSVGVEHPKARLTPEIVTTIRARRQQGALIKTLAAEYGVSGASITGIVQGRYWAYVPMPE